MITVKDAILHFLPDEISFSTCEALGIDLFHYPRNEKELLGRLKLIFKQIAEQTVAPSALENTLISHMVMSLDGSPTYKCSLFDTGTVNALPVIREYNNIGCITNLYENLVPKIDEVSDDELYGLLRFQFPDAIEWDRTQFWTDILGAALLEHQQASKHLVSAVLAEYIQKEIEYDPYYMMSIPNCEQPRFSGKTRKKQMMFAKMSLYFEIMMSRHGEITCVHHDTDLTLPRIFSIQKAQRTECCSIYTRWDYDYCPRCGKRLSEFIECHHILEDWSPTWLCVCGHEEAVDNCFCGLCGRKHTRLSNAFGNHGQTNVSLPNNYNDMLS